METPCSISNQEAKHIVGDDTTPYWQGESSSLRTLFVYLYLEWFLMGELELREIAEILDIDANCIETESDGIYINKCPKQEKVVLQFSALSNFIEKSYSFDFKFFNFSIQNSISESVNKNSNLQKLEFVDCEFENFCISSLTAKEISFTNCVFKHNFTLISCKIDNIQLDKTQICGEFKLISHPEFNMNSFVSNEVEFHKKASVQGAFKQITLDNTHFKSSLELSHINVENKLSFKSVTFSYNLIIKENIINELCFQDISFIDKYQGFKHNQFKGFKIENSTFKEKMSFENCIFDEDVYFLNDNTFQSYVYFDRTQFRKEIKFEKHIFEKEVKFKDCDFSKNTYFSNIKFNESAYFNNSTFHKYADFHECEFEKTACFYGVSFEETPNFSQALFKGNLNLVNTNLNFNFEDLELRIQNEFQSYKENKGDSDKKSLENFTNDFRDSFRNFKSTLIKEHNVLDALNYYKVELYCKEIELKQKWDKKGVEAKNEADIKKNISRFKEFIDFLLLNFYRKLCEHHTDFLRIFNNLILLIALYMSFYYLGNFQIDCGDCQNVSQSSILSVDVPFTNMLLILIRPHKDIFLYVFLAIVIIQLIYMIWIVCKGIPLIQTIAKISYKTILKDVSYFLIGILCIFCIFILFNIYTPKDTNKLYLYNIVFFLFFIEFYLGLVCMKTIFIRYFLIWIAYVIVLIGMGANVALINPLIGKLVDDSIKINNSSLLSITFAYTILMALVLFSLQKTARKNSIIPS